MGIDTVETVAETTEAVAETAETMGAGADALGRRAVDLGLDLSKSEAKRVAKALASFEKGENVYDNYGRRTIRHAAGKVILKSAGVKPVKKNKDWSKAIAAMSVEKASALLAELKERVALLEERVAKG